MRCVNANDALVMFSSCDKERIDLLVCNYVYDGERLLYASTDSAGDATAARRHESYVTTPINTRDNSYSGVKRP